VLCSGAETQPPLLLMGALTPARIVIVLELWLFVPEIPKCC